MCPVPAALRMPRCQQCQDRVGLGTQQGDHPLLVGSLDSHLSTLAPLLPARYNLLFFASGGGKFNYQGTKRWLEDNLDHTGEQPPLPGWALGRRCSPTPPAHQPSLSADSSLLQDNVAFVLCLDTVGRGDSLHLHVSKPPREGTLQHAFLRELETVGAPWGLGGDMGAAPVNPGALVGFPVGRWASPQAPEAGGWGGTGDPSGCRGHLYRGR